MHDLPRIMAHRGARALWAENSATGFRNTLAAGFDAVEFDLHLTDAGEIVVIHDATLERTTTATGPVRALTPESRRALRLKGPDGAPISEGIASFEEVLALFTAYPETALYVELKSDETGTPYPDLPGRAISALRAAGMAGRTVLHSFDIDVLHEIARVAPECGRLISVNRDWAARRGGIAAILREVEELVDIVGIHHELYEAEFDTITRLRPAAQTSVWTVNDPELMRRWIARKPGFLTSDNPVLAREVLTAVTA